MGTVLVCAKLFFILLSNTCVISMITAGQGQRTELHKIMAGNREDFVKLFDSADSYSVPEYEVVSISHRRLRRDIDSDEDHHQFNAFNRDFDLSLRPSYHVVSPQLVLMRSRSGDVWTKQLYTPEGRFLQGHVTDDPHSHVAVRELAPQQLSGAILSDGHEYKIEPVPHHIKRQMSLTGQDHHVITRRSLKYLRPYAKPIKVEADSLMDALQSRWRRSVMGPKIIEAMITIDKPTTDFYGNHSMNYVLAIANMANRLYSDSSIGFQCTFSLTKIFLIESDLPELDIKRNAIGSASSYLNVFRKWFQTVNTPAGSIEHFDNAVLLTREICGINRCELDGLAYFNVPCSSSLGASINDAHGVSTAFSVVHEMAHNFGVDHDYGACSNGHIMSAGQSTGANAFKWSSCSRDTFKAVFSRVTCYNNYPPTNITLPRLPPGHTFDSDQQCKFIYGDAYTLCPLTTDNCGTLYCYHGSMCTNIRGTPPVDGTPCGNRKWCISGHCVDVGNSFPPAVDGRWGAWGPYGACSRTCGGGVQHRTRKCDSPKPAFGGKDCVGSAMGDWKICNTQGCQLTGNDNYRKTQCKALSSSYDTYFITDDRCALWCRTGGSAAREGNVADGTKYDDSNPDTRDICIGGQRVAVGCDDVIGSGSIKDRCRRCLGNGSTCVYRVERFTTPWWNYGPWNAIPMLTLPVGTVNADIQEDSATKNLVNLKLYPPEKNALIFRNRPVTSSRHVAGTVVRYYIGPLLYAERMHIVGPTTQKLVPMYAHIDGANVGYTIKYFAPGQANYTDFIWKTEFTSNCSKTCAGGFRPRTVTCHREDDESQISGIHCARTRPPDNVPCNSQPCPEEWQTEPWGSCSRKCGGGNRTRRVPCVRRVTQQKVIPVDDQFCNASSRPVTSSSCNVVDCGPGWEISKWAKCRGNPGSQGVATRTVECRNRFANGSFPIVDQQACVAISAKIPDVIKNCTVDEEVPGLPYGISVSFDGEIYHVTWQTPQQTNGVILGYKVYFELTNPKEGLRHTIIETKGTATRAGIPLTRLHGDKTYMVRVAGRTSKGYGDKSKDNKIIQTPVTAPPVPTLPPEGPGLRYTTAEIVIPQFSNINGPVKYYQVVNVVYPPGSTVSPGKDPANKTLAEFVTYCSAHASSEPAVYIAFQFPANEYDKYKSFTLGTGEGTKCSKRRRSLEETQYYNGPLQPNIEYKPFVRGYTSETEYSQYNYDSFKLQGAPKQSARTSDGNTVVWIVVGCAVVIILVVVVAILAVKKLRQAQRDCRDVCEGNGSSAEELHSLGNLDPVKV